jgi:phenylpropionate dioxygenase-like ring-hydroxylating dioxygenase large terminal subunit
MATTIGRLRDVAGVLVLGLRDYWYPVILSSRVGASEPVAVRALGEELAIWRDNAGNVHVFFDACPHRRAQLSLGNVRADRLQCVYHGLEFDGSGQCVQIPWEEPGTPQLRQLAARAYPAADSGGFIWAYFGTSAPPPPLEHELPPELLDRNYVTYFQEEIWDVPWPLSLEGSFDPQHNQFLHADSYLQKQLQGRGGNIQSYKMKVVKTETLWAPRGWRHLACRASVCSGWTLMARWRRTWAAALRCRQQSHSCSDSPMSQS